MDLNTVQFETSGDGEKEFSNKQINMASINMISKNSGCGENALSEVTYRLANIQSTGTLHRTVRKENNWHNSKLQSSSSKSAYNFNECCSQVSGKNCKSSSEHQRMLKDTPRSNNDLIQSIKPFEKIDDNITVQSYILSKNGYFNSKESLSLSLTSLISSQSHEEQEAINSKKIEAFNNWLIKKEDERKRKILKMKPFVKPDRTEITPEKKEILFQKWLGKKQLIKEANKEKLLLKSQQDEERKKQKEMGKEEKLFQWSKKKSEILKDIKISEIQRTTAIQHAKNVKRIESEKAYERWLQESKCKPLPVPLNKGKLSMRSTLSAMYVNPEPWKFSYDERVDDTA